MISSKNNPVISFLSLTEMILLQIILLPAISYADSGYENQKIELTINAAAANSDYFEVKAISRVAEALPLRLRVRIICGGTTTIDRTVSVSEKVTLSAGSVEAIVESVSGLSGSSIADFRYCQVIPIVSVSGPGKALWTISNEGIVFSNGQSGTVVETTSEYNARRLKERPVKFIPRTKEDLEMLGRNALPEHLR